MMKFCQPPYPTVYFSKEIWVYCPKCSKPALVETKLPQYTLPFPRDHKSVFNCSFCGHQEKSSDEKWSGYMQGFISIGCGNCGSKLSYTTKPTKEQYNTLKISCEVCNKEKEYKIDWFRYRNDKATDPYFGFDLLLQTSIKNNNLWLYNIEHLEYLKEYVEAKLREDDTRHKYSMITNLPQWVKSSKNREHIVKKLNKLKREFEKKVM